MYAWLGRITIAIALFIAVVPIGWAFLTSIKLPRDFYTLPPTLFSNPPSLHAYTALFEDFDMLKYLRNTAIIAVLNTITVMAIALPAAHARARYNLGSTKFSVWLLLQRLMPTILVLLPIYIIFSEIGWIDTYHGVSLAYMVFTLPLAIWMLTAFFAGFPRDLHDQAQVDGCTELQALVRIIVPVLAPGVTAVAFLVFVTAWNELLYALILTGNDTKPLMVFFTNLAFGPAGEFLGEAAATVLVGAIPAYILALVFQRYLVSGFGSGAVK